MESKISVKKYIKKNEGLSLKPYKCLSGATTIGYGRNLSSVGINNNEANILFYTDFNEAENGAFAIFGEEFFKNLSYLRRMAILDMIFNLGFNGFLNFKNFIAAIKEKNFNKASDEIRHSLYYKQVTNRAKQNANLIKYEIYYKL